MEEIVFVRTPDCRACMYELRDAPSRKLETIINERRRCRKCNYCERLRKAAESLRKHKRR
jgi:hypothetical protein